MGIPEKMETLGTQDTGPRQTKQDNTTQKTKKRVNNMNPTTNQ